MFLLEFQGAFFSDFGVILRALFDMFSQLFAPLVFMIFDNLSNRKLVFHRSHGITFNTFCACFFDFISSVIFDMIFSTFEAILVSILSQKMKKNSSWKSLFFWLRKKSHRICFLHFRTPFGVIFGSLLLDFRVPFFIVFYGGGREAFRHRLVPFWSYFGVIFMFFCCFFACNLNLFDPGLIFETKTRKQKLR